MNIFLPSEKIINIILTHIQNIEAVDLDQTKYNFILQDILENVKIENIEKVKLIIKNNIWLLAPISLLNINQKIKFPDGIDASFYKTIKNIAIYNNINDSLPMLIIFLIILQEIIAYRIIKKHTDSARTLLNIRKKIFNICKMLSIEMVDSNMLWLADLIGKYTHLAKTGNLDREKILTKVNNNIFCEIILNVWYADLDHLSID